MLRTGIDTCGEAMPPSETSTVAALFLPINAGAIGEITETFPSFALAL